MKISEIFLKNACNILAETNNGLTGTQFTEICCRYALEYNVDIPFLDPPFESTVGKVNKRTALFRNVVCFSSEVQYELIKELCDKLLVVKANSTLYGRSEKPNKEVNMLKKKLVDLYGGSKDYPIKKVKSNTINDKLPEELYEEILETIRNYGQSIEKSTRSYQNKDEESLRDLFCIDLNGRFERTTVTGETFNKKGKTDILLKSDSGKNLFIAECKIWKGGSNFNAALDQLIEQYLTWHDIFSALLLFVQRSDISNVLEKVKNFAKDHKYFGSFLKENDNSLSYKFRLPNDSSERINLEIIIFHFPRT